MSAEPKGFRRDIMVLHTISDLMEKHPSVPRPTVQFTNYGAGNLRSISWHLGQDYHLRGELTEEEEDTLGWDERYVLKDKRTADLRRVDLETKIAAILDAIEEFGGIEGEWEKNSPEDDAYSYTLIGKWQGANVRISCNRDAVCEKVVVLETEREEEQPDPEWLEKVTSAAPKVKVKVTDTITEWQCNSALAEKTKPMYARTVERAS